MSLASKERMRVERERVILEYRKLKQKNFVFWSWKIDQLLFLHLVVSFRTILLHKFLNPKYNFNWVKWVFLYHSSDATISHTFSNGLPDAPKLKPFYLTTCRMVMQQYAWLLWSWKLAWQFGSKKRPKGTDKRRSSSPEKLLSEACLTHDTRNVLKAWWFLQRYAVNFFSLTSRSVKRRDESGLPQPNCITQFIQPWSIGQALLYIIAKQWRL